MNLQQHNRYVYLYQPKAGILLLSDALQVLYALPRSQRLCPPGQWLNCFPRAEQMRLKLAFTALAMAHTQESLQFSLKLNSHSYSGEYRYTEHQLCNVSISKQRFICGRVTPIWNPRPRLPASHPQSAYWSAHQAVGISPHD